MPEDFNNAQWLAIELDSELYQAIQEAYLREYYSGDGNSMNQHCHGMAAAVRAIYELGWNNGYTHACIKLRKEETKQ